MRNRWIIGLIVAAAVVVPLAISSCSGSKAQGVVNVDATKAQELLADSGVHVVDVRTAGEFEAGRLKGAENVPVDQVASLASGWDRKQPLLVYCATGARSATAVQQLQSMGFETIYHFNQGLVAWQGNLDTGAAPVVAQGATVKTNGKPVLYEFFTDW